jgi:hypothetical protein
LSYFGCGLNIPENATGCKAKQPIFRQNTGKYE